MTDSIRKTVYNLMKFSAFRKAAGVPIAFGNLFRKELMRYRQDTKRLLEERIHHEYFKEDLTVLSGPFKGMIYPEFVSFNSARLPKLMGTYESEIYPDLERLTSERPELLIDIGAADGYYAVGLARRLPGTPVRCFDLNPEALAFCHRMAELNQAKNLSIETIFQPAYFESLREKRALLIVDIDGGEKPLFTEDAVKCLKKSSLIIETHDYLDESITRNLTALFSATHKVKIISWKPNKLDEIPGFLGALPTDEKRAILLERIVDNKWMIIEPK